MNKKRFLLRNWLQPDNIKGGEWRFFWPCKYHSSCKAFICCMIAYKI